MKQYQISEILLNMPLMLHKPTLIEMAVDASRPECSTYSKLRTGVIKKECPSRSLLTFAETKSIEPNHINLPINILALIRERNDAQKQWQRTGNPSFKATMNRLQRQNQSANQNLVTNT
jgi:hypothetical protein